MLSIEDLESLEETLDVLSNPALMNNIREAVDGLSPGEETPLTKAQALKLIARR